MIKAVNLRKTYRDKIAVDDISFKVETGKVTGFLGPNGAGKSTTMRLMLGLDNGTGQTTYDGKRLQQYAEPSQVVGILLEAKAFHPTRTAYNHLSVMATSGNIPQKRVDEVLDIVGLKDVAKKKPGKFSLGMSQRLGIAAALLGKPKYLMLDEPANGLDPEGMAWLREFLKDYADNGNGVLVSSHLLSEMAQMADNVVVIGKGKLITQGPLKQLLASNTRNAVFVRTTNLSAFEKTLNSAKISFQKEGKGLRVTGVKTDDLGKLAFKSGVTVLELSGEAVSLEEAFLELTADTEEFGGNKLKGGKK